MSAELIMDPDKPTPRPPEQELARRRRARNWALFIVLLGFAVLFYAIAIVKMSK